jgi:transcriptional regulator with GAF, ATPase, and Fis domain
LVDQYQKPYHYSYPLISNSGKKQIDQEGDNHLIDKNVKAHLLLLFLDEIGEMPTHLQAKLLRVIETGSYTPLGSDKEKTVNVRIIAATNRPEELRLDHYYRLAEGVIDLPPLRNRGTDILLTNLSYT